MESDRLGACTDPAVRAGIGRHIAWLEAEEAEADRPLEQAVRASPAWHGRDELLRSIPGIGPVVSRTLLAARPELGAGDGGELAALAGLAPYVRDSGASSGPRSIRGGRPGVRQAMDLVALSASRRDGPLKEFADRLKARGKRAKVVLIAVARRLPVIASAVIRTGTPWKPGLAMPRGLTANPTR